MSQTSVQERSVRWLLLLTFLHTVPVVWVTPIAAGTAPTAALLALGFASLVSFDREDMALAWLALGPAILYSGIGWILSWWFAKTVEKLRKSTRAALLAILIVASLMSVYWPIYVAGGYDASYNVNLLQLFGRTLDWRILLGYWITLHILLIVLYVTTLFRRGHPALELVDSWRRPALTMTAAGLCAALFISNFPRIVCVPLAELGNGRAALCVARSVSTEQRHWYQIAADQGYAEAIAWMIDHARNTEQRIRWLHKGALLGNSAIQFELYKVLLESDEYTYSDAESWLRSAAEGNHVAAQMVLVDSLTRTVHDTGKHNVLVERNAWLERAAGLGGRDAKRHLAQHHGDGSMGYPADLNRARDLYRDLARLTIGDNTERPTTYELMLNIDSAYYNARIAELDAWEKGLDRRDPEIVRSIAERYLKSPYPGPGVREQGRKMMEDLAADDDPNTRDTLSRIRRSAADAKT